MEKRNLQRFHIIDVASGGQYKHPVIDFLSREKPRLSGITETCRGIADRGLIRAYVMANSGFVADGIERIKTFILEPLDLVAIWACVQVYPFHRYYLAKVIPTAYAIQGRSSLWEDFTRHYRETGELPRRVLGDHQGLVAVHRRLTRVNNNLHKIDTIAYGAIESPGDAYRRLRGRIAMKDENALQEADWVAVAHNEMKIPLISDMREAMDNNIDTLLSHLRDAKVGKYTYA